MVFRQLFAHHMPRERAEDSWQEAAGRRRQSEIGGQKTEAWLVNEKTGELEN
jgi:hypothetical protein